MPKAAHSRPCSGEHLQGRLTAPIGGHAQFGLFRPDRRDIDDPAVLLFDHLPGHKPAQEPYGLDVRIEDLVPAVFTQIQRLRRKLLAHC
jgi:hypothetical protein